MELRCHGFSAQHGSMNSGVMMGDLFSLTGLLSPISSKEENASACS